MTDLAVAPATWQAVREEFPPETARAPRSGDPVKYALGSNAEHGLTIILTFAEGGLHEIPWWVDRLVARLDELVNGGVLRRDWNGHGAAALDGQAVAFAFRVLADLLTSEHRPFPEVVPTYRGGIEFEWRLDYASLTVDIDPNGTVDVYFEDVKEQREWEGSLTERSAEVRDILDQFGSWIDRR